MDAYSGMGKRTMRVTKMALSNPLFEFGLCCMISGHPTHLKSKPHSSHGQGLRRGLMSIPARTLAGEQGEMLLVPKNDGSGNGSWWADVCGRAW